MICGMSSIACESWGRLTGSVAELDGQPPFALTGTGDTSIDSPPRIDQQGSPPPRIELVETVRACGSLRSPFRAVTRLLNSGRPSLSVSNRSLSLTVAEVQSALPELNGGQVDLQSTALPG